MAGNSKAGPREFSDEPGQTPAGVIAPVLDKLLAICREIDDLADATRDIAPPQAVALDHASAIVGTVFENLRSMYAALEIAYWKQWREAQESIRKGVTPNP